MRMKSSYKKSSFPAALRIITGISPLQGKSVLKDIVSLIQSFGRQSGIVYCLSQRECEETAKTLLQSGIKARLHTYSLKKDAQIGIDNQTAALFMTNKV
jgi:superfamily II DNA helicase RecQ